MSRKNGFAESRVEAVRMPPFAGTVAQLLLARRGHCLCKHIRAPYSIIPSIKKLREIIFKIKN